MTPEQIDLVQSSSAKVAPIAGEAARIFYARLFEIAPEVRPLFPADLSEQGKKLMSVLAFVVNGLRAPETIIPAAEKLAVRHLDYGVGPQHYAPVGQALIDTLEKGLGDAFTPDVRQAWLAAYTLLSGVMIKAAYGTARAAE
jgi:nitric oxide dioxygenase